MSNSFFLAAVLLIALGIVGCTSGPAASPDASPTSAPSTPVAPGDYFKQLARLRAEESADGETLAREMIGDLIDDAASNVPAQEWQPRVSRFYLAFGDILDDFAGRLAQIAPPPELRVLHGDLIVEYRALAVELRESSEELGPHKLDDALGGFAIAYLDFLSSPCSDLQRIADDNGIDVDLLCP